MSYILHLGHQPTDISGIGSLISNAAGGFDPTLDVNAIRSSAARNSAFPVAINIPAPVGDLWLGFRYVTPNLDANTITETNASFLEFFDAAQNMIAQVQPNAATERYHATARGDTVVQGNSTYIAGAGQAQWVDVRLAVGAQITLDFYVDGFLHSTATAANTAGTPLMRGKPVQIVFPNIGLHGYILARTWSFAHIAVLDGRSTIGRRFVRRTPSSVAIFNEMAGSLDAIRDEDVSTRIASNIAGQRTSFNLTGPSGPIATTAIAAVQIKQLTQAGTSGPQATAGFLRIGSANHDAPAVPVPQLAPRPVYSSWVQNPSTNAMWTSATLPVEVGVVSQ
jgi:hypothetical protein